MHKFNHDFSCILAIFAVSLFTREWIEILMQLLQRYYPVRSPSLRGSGLKSFGDLGFFDKEYGLPLYEGVD